MTRIRWAPSSAILERAWHRPCGIGGNQIVTRVAGRRPRLGGGRLARLALAGALFASLHPASTYGETVFGYYAGYEYWQMSPEQVDWSGVNCIIHFAADPHGDGTIDLNRFQLFPARIEQMVQLARDNEACVLLTVGGANTKWAFAEATANATVRAKLVENIVDAVAQHGYDGVDIDWEPLQDSDQAQFTAFIRELRARLDAAVPGAMLTAAVPIEWGTLEAKRTTSMVASVIDELDFIHLMAYALAGPWGGWVTWHNSALYNGGATFPKGTKELPSAELMVEQYAAAGVPYNKMTLGLAFFGKIWQGGKGTPTGGVTAPRQSWTTKPTMSGEHQYHRIIARKDFRGNDRWDDSAKNPYVSVNKSGSANDLFIPYENPRSIQEKVRYAAERGLAGVMIWELRGDFLPDGSHPLVSALKAEYLAQYGHLPGDLAFDVSSADPDPLSDSPPATTMHVADLDASLLVERKHWWKSAVNVAVRDNSGDPVAAAAVKGKWSSGVTGTCKTNSTGRCAFPPQSFAKKDYPKVTFAVTRISHGSFSYAAADNRDPDGDNDGTAITIMRP
jgi:chitinase